MHIHENREQTGTKYGHYLSLLHLFCCLERIFERKKNVWENNSMTDIQEKGSERFLETQSGFVC